MAYEDNKDSLEIATEFVAPQEGMAKVKSDGLVYAYYDVVGVPTQGIGIVVPSVDVPAITKEEAEQRFKAKLALFYRKVAKLVSVPVNAWQMAAMTSFAYNVGVFRFKGSSLRSKLNRRDYAGAADEFMKFCYAKGKLLKGLQNRRRRERALFLRVK